jgi:glucan 1,3-beta-glucosidase
LKAIREINIFAIVLVIQSLPFIAAVLMALLERSSLNDFATWSEIETRVSDALGRRPALTKAPAPAPVQDHQRELVQ